MTEPPSHRLVPVEATDKVYAQIEFARELAWREYERTHEESIGTERQTACGRAAYKAMIAAAPNGGPDGWVILTGDEHKALLAAAPQPPAPVTWLPISAYPTTTDRGGHKWGDRATLLFADKSAYCGHLEADMWLWNAPDDCIAWARFPEAPIAFLPLPEPPYD